MEWVKVNWEEAAFRLVNWIKCLLAAIHHSHSRRTLLAYKHPPGKRVLEQDALSLRLRKGTRASDPPALGVTGRLLPTSDLRGQV